MATVIEGVDIDINMPMRDSILLETEEKNMNHFFVECNGYNVSVCEWGDKNNPQIICFHGLGSTKLSFIEIAEQLKDTYHIVSFDLPGHGKTSSFEKDEDYGAAYLTYFQKNSPSSRNEKGEAQ